MKTRRLLCVWERGGGTGHLYRMSMLGRILGNRGHKTCFCVQDVRFARRFLFHDDVTLNRLPAGLAQKRNALARSHAELLFNLGFGDLQRLSAYLAAWRRLLMDMKPDAVFCDHADGALLAAYSYGIPALVIGNSFFHPPVEAPLPTFDLGLAMDLTNTMQAEDLVLNAVNSALKAFGSRPLHCLADLYAYAERVVLSFPELDCYGMRRDIDYLGVLGPTLFKAEPVWDHDGEKVFCYFTRGCLPDPSFVKQLVGNGYSLLIAAPGIGADQRATLAGQGVTVMDRQVDLDRVCAECRLVFSEGNHGTTSEILRHGRVPLLLPRQVEQLATANVLAKHRLGVLPPCPLREPVYLNLIKTLYDEPAYERNALEFSRKYHGWDQVVCAEHVEASVIGFIES